MKLNDIIHNFKLISIENVKDINAKLYQFEHIKSKGLVAYLECDDTNCCFAIGFKTLPEDSTGVCHIIEHSLLCGSKKYPLKEPFVNLLKTSLSTFLNAFTAYDWTMYPFASQTPKDFDNILKIYCDAVFNPLSVIDEKPFLQEGWHLELLNENDLPSYKGVVYNEMKGAMSSVDECLTQATLEAMYKDTCYRHNSGGDPDVIPNLTYEAYKDFYHRHYTPQNALTYFYGKLNIEEKLQFLDEEYFSKYEAKNDVITITPQKPLINLDYKKEYEIGEDEDVKDNTYMSLCYGLDNYNNNETLMAVNVLCDALLSKNDSPLKKAMLDAKLAQNVECRIDDDNIIPALHIYLQKTNVNKKEEFRSTFINEVKKLVDNGIDKELLLASINHLEFKDKELDAGGMPKGLIFAMQMMGSFNYNGKLTSHLEFIDNYQKFKKELYNGYFEKILEKYILNSNHYVQVVLTPSKELGLKKKKLMDEKMKQIKDNMSHEEVLALIKQTNELIAYQNHIDTKKELKCLPQLKLKDIPTSINYLATKKDTINGMRVITHNLNTNDIAYLRMYFSIKKINEEDLPYVLLLKCLLRNVPTNNYDTLALNNIIKTFLGDLYFNELVFSKDKDDYSFLFKVSTSALNENINYIPDMINEVLLHSKFNKKEVLQIIKQITTSLRQSIIENGNRIAKDMARSCFTKEASITTNGLSGLNVYKFFNSLSNNYNHTLVNKKLKEISEKIFNKKNAIISLSGNDTTLALLKASIKNIKLPRKEYADVLNVTLSKDKNCALKIPSGVSYNALACSLNVVNEKFSGKYLVLSHIVNYDYLWAEVRVKGGAYGCSLQVYKNNDVAFSTYRDPNVKNSYQTFKNLVKYLKGFKVSKDEFTSYIIGAMGGFDAPLSNPLLIDTWDINYLSNYTKEDKINLKKQILKTKIEDINELASVFEKLFNDCATYTIGNEAKINEYDFDSVKSL